MSALKERQCYGLSGGALSRGANISVFHVKLTDSAARAIGSFQNGKVGSVLCFLQHSLLEQQHPEPTGVWLLSSQHFPSLQEKKAREGGFVIWSRTSALYLPPPSLPPPLGRRLLRAPFSSLASEMGIHVA